MTNSAAHIHLAPDLEATRAAFEWQSNERTGDLSGLHAERCLYV